MKYFGTNIVHHTLLTAPISYAMCPLGKLAPTKGVIFFVVQFLHRLNLKHNKDINVGIIRPLDLQRMCAIGVYYETSFITHNI